MFLLGLAEPELRKALSLLLHQFSQARDAERFRTIAGAIGNAGAAQDLIDELLLGAKPIYVTMHDQCGLSDASDRLQMNFFEIIEYVYSGRFVRIGNYLQRSGFASVLVNVGQKGEAISQDAFACWQGLRAGDLITIARLNELSYRQVCGPRGGAQLLMSAADRIAFHDRLMSFRDLGVATPMQCSALHAPLAAGGIQPSGGRARTYARCEIIQLLP